MDLEESDAAGFFIQPNAQRLSAAEQVMDRVAELTGLPPSPIDVDVLARLSGDDLLIYSGGISTAGIFEIAAALDNGDRRIIATTIDPNGRAFTNTKIAQVDTHFRQPVAQRIAVLKEDLSQPLSPERDSADVTYSRLALHYLEPAQRAAAIKRLADITKSGGAVVIAVRAAESLRLNPNVISFDRGTGRVEIRRADDSILVQVRHLPTPEELLTDLEEAGLVVVHGVQSLVEQTYEDYERARGGGLDNVLLAMACKV